MTESKGTTTTSTTDPDAISWLRSTLHSVDQRCTNLQSDLKKAQQVINSLNQPLNKSAVFSNESLDDSGLLDVGRKSSWIGSLFG